MVQSADLVGGGSGLTTRDGDRSTYVRVFPTRLSHRKKKLLFVWQLARADVLD